MAWQVVALCSALGSSGCASTRPWTNEPLAAQETVRYDGLAQLFEDRREITGGVAHGARGVPDRCGRLLERSDGFVMIEAVHQLHPLVEPLLSGSHIGRDHALIIAEALVDQSAVLGSVLLTTGGQNGRQRHDGQNRISNGLQGASHDPSSLPAVGG